MIGLLLGVITVLLSATKGQAKTIAAGVGSTNIKLEVMSRGVVESNRKLDEGNAKLDQVAAGVAETNRSHEEGNARLDQIVQLLRDIRDRAAIG